MSARIQSFPASRPIFRNFPGHLELHSGHLLVVGLAQRAFKINNVYSYGKYLTTALVTFPPLHYCIV